MPRAVWSGAISFGMVSIPVRLYPATSPRDPRFHLIDRATGRRVRYRRVVEQPVASAPVEMPSEPPEATERAAPASPAPAAEREVAFEDTARGYEIAPGEQVVVEQEELEELRPEPSRVIEIEHFVRLSDIDPVYYEKSYHLAPADEVAEKPYALLREAMERSGRVAVGRFVLRTREHLVAIRPTLGILGLETFYFADEVREPAPAWRRAARARDGEVEMARQLIEALAAEWDPAGYRDPYRERVLELLRSREPVAAPDEDVAEPAGPQVPDLMEALKASVEAAREASRKKGRGSGRRRAGSGGGR
jgi:DNA end-binding protein Ku